MITRAAEPPHESSAVPKLVQSAAEYNLTEHCNLSCAGCDHSSPLLPKKFADVRQFERDLSALSQVMHLGELKLLGGEPLLHPDLLEFLRCARASGIADEITLVTNGLLLHRCDPAILESIDRLWISLYPGISLRIEERELESLSKKHNFALDLRRINHFRVTTINSRLEDPALVRRIFERCTLAHSGSCHTISEGYYFKCSPAALLTSRMALAGETIRNRDLDGVKIHDNPRLREELEAYLRAEEPLEACRYCLGSSGRSFPHRQLADKELREDTGASGTPRIRHRLSTETRLLADLAIDTIADEQVTMGLDAMREGDRILARRRYLDSIRKRPLNFKTYIRLSWAFLPSGVTGIISAILPSRLRRSLSGPRFAEEKT
jgi:hypothetical protein